MAELAERAGIDLATSTAYSDSATDLPMLEAVGHPVVVNPDRALAKLARERGWDDPGVHQAGAPARPDDGDRPGDHHGRPGPGRGGPAGLAARPAAAHDGPGPGAGDRRSSDRQPGPEPAGRDLAQGPDSSGSEASGDGWSGRAETLGGDDAQGDQHGHDEELLHGADRSPPARWLVGPSQTVSRSRAPVSEDGCRSLDMARASIWRMRSRVKLKCSPTSSSVRGSPRSSPKRSRRISPPARRAGTAAGRSRRPGGRPPPLRTATGDRSSPPRHRARRRRPRAGAQTATAARPGTAAPRRACSSGISTLGAPARPTVGRSAELELELALGLLDRAQHVPGVHRQADGPTGVGDAPGDGLADPPRGVGRELEALAPVELLDGVDQAEVALLDQVQEGQSRRLVLLGDRHHQAQVGRHEGLLGRASAAITIVRNSRCGAAVVDPLAVALASSAGIPAGLDGLGQPGLVVLGEQRVLPDVRQVEPDEVLVVPFDAFLRQGSAEPSRTTWCGSPRPGMTAEPVRPPAATRSPCTHSVTSASRSLSRQGAPERRPQIVPTAPGQAPDPVRPRRPPRCDSSRCWTAAPPQRRRGAPAAPRSRVSPARHRATSSRLTRSRARIAGPSATATARSWCTA